MQLFMYFYMLFVKSSRVESVKSVKLVIFAKIINTTF